ncbi:MAG TPA: hypothetical protein VIM12_17730 [Noviherbaspirillum sp.]|jgi:hypothetical protein|uniref:hypothetical protein n=1 Tax=Noviherbaspirillum sp. TaxID=1926288 RepID=UPI002F95409C
MNELVQRLIERTGLPEDKAMRAVETMSGFLKERLPEPVAAQVDGVLGGGEGGQGGGMLGNAGGMASGLGGMLGKH